MMHNRLLLLNVTAAFAAVTLSLSAAVPYDGQMVPGEYEISTFTQLTNFTEKVRSYDYAGSTITLVSDIDCGGRRILPGNRVNPATFCGTFDGGGHKIERILNQIFIVDPGSHYGSALFDVVKNGAVILNLTLEGEVYVSQSDDIEDMKVKITRKGFMFEDMNNVLEQINALTDF